MSCQSESGSSNIHLINNYEILSKNLDMDLDMLMMASQESRPQPCYTPSLFSPESSFRHLNYLTGEPTMSIHNEERSCSSRSNHQQWGESVDSMMFWDLFSA